MLKKKTVLLAVVVIAALTLCGCSTTGSAIQGVGGVFNKAGGAVKRL